MRISALILASAWAVFWTWFGLASGISEGLDAIGVIIHTSLPGLVFLGTAALAWRRGRVGGIILVLEGIVTAIGYPLMVGGRFPFETVLFVLCTMALPPLILGVLLVKASKI
jgi:hypothetical protein